MRRIAVVGTAGSGKSTVSAELARALGVPWVELDALYHLPDWGKPADEEFRRKVTDALDGDGWVVDGNYRVSHDIALDRADTVVWLDLPRWVVMTRLLRRTAGRVSHGTELWSGNREQLRDMVSFDASRNILLWGWKWFPEYRRRYAARMSAAGDGPAFVRLRTANEVELFLAAVRMRAPAQRSDDREGETP